MTQLEKSRLIVSQSISDSTGALFVSLQAGTPHDYTVLMLSMCTTVLYALLHHHHTHGRVTLFAEGMTNLGESPVTVLEATLAISANAALVALAYT